MYCTQYYILSKPFLEIRVLMILMMMMMTITARRAKDTVCATMHFCDSAEVGALDLCM